MTEREDVYLPIITKIKEEIIIENSKMTSKKLFISNLI